MINDIFKVQEDENFEDYRHRIYEAKIFGHIDNSWTEISQIFGQNFGEYKDESKWRKEAKKLKDFFNVGTVMLTEDAEETTKSIQELNDLLLKYKKERVKMSEERTQNNAYIRRLAREETLTEIAKYAADNMSTKKILQEHTPNSTNGEFEAIVQLSDWHYGIEINNFINVYNTDICKKRVQKLLNECINYFTKNPVSKIYLINLGDLICGRIHQTLRLQSRIDVITQILEVSELLAEFINELTKIAPVIYYDCTDNHSRLEPNKSDSLELETLTRIIPWYLKERFKNDLYVNIMENDIHDDLITFKSSDFKWQIGGVHGHKDKLSKVVDNLTMITKINFDLLLTSHFHHFVCEEKNHTVVVGNSSLMGTDVYAYDLRLSAAPSQNIILMSDKSPVADIHRVVLE